METINQRVAHCRKLAGFTQADVAEKLNIKVSTYSQMERKGNITAQLILDLADIFNIDPNEMLYSELPKEIAKQPEATPPIPQDPPPLLLTNLEENIIKILRNIPKEDFEEIKELILQKHNKNFGKK